MKNKEQTLHDFWSQFNVKAYDESTVPEDAVLPRITYEVVTDSFGYEVGMTASIWDRSRSWESVTDILHRIEHTISRGGQTLPYEGGMMWIKKGSPFAQRMADTDDSIRRIVLNINVEYISEE